MRIRSFILLSALLVLSGCASSPTKPMAQVSYQKPIMSSSQRAATLVWRMGKVQGARTDEADVNGGGDDLLTDAVVQLFQPKSSADVVFAYGKAQQSVFMTSLQKVLQKNNVFSQVDLKSYTAQQPAKNVTIEVYFKRTSVGEKSRFYPMSLDVSLVIHAKGKVWSQHYYIEQKDSARAWTDLYAAQSHAASVKLMNKVMAGIQSWIQQHG